MTQIYKCCRKCNYPTYFTCKKTHGSPDWRCPTDGVHCILQCVKDYGPGTAEVIIKPGGGFGDGFKTLGNGEMEVEEVSKDLICEKEETLPDGNTCIRRLCIPLNT